MTLTAAAAAWGVLMLFLIPVGGGIPAGVLLARGRGIPWPATTGLYFVSDVILACVFEPVLRLLIAWGRRVPLFTRVVRAMRESMLRTAACYGSAGGPLALIMVAFGVDPMTGRAAAAAAGHGFVSGWAIAITGDMMYFLVIMSATLWLKGVVGDGTSVVALMLVVMFLLPMGIRRLRR